MPLLINVCGPARSGTTMLDLMLGNAHDAFSCGEVYAWYRPWRKHHFSIRCSCGKSPCLIWEKLKDVPESRFHSRALEVTQSNYIVDSSKEICWVLDNQEWANQAGITVVNLLIWKSPLDLSYSHWKRGCDLMFWREQFVNYYQNFFSTGMPFIAVSFDDLVATPKVKLEQVCKAAGVPYSVNMEEFWARQHHHLFGSLGTRKQIEVGNSEVSSTQFTSEFLSIAKGMSERIAQDAAVQDIMQLLRQKDVSKHQVDFGVGINKLSRPAWYYYKKAKQKIYRIFPKPSLDG